MGMLDNLKDKGSELMNDPDKREQIEQIAKDKGISIDEAKNHFMKQHGE